MSATQVVVLTPAALIVVGARRARRPPPRRPSNTTSGAHRRRAGRSAQPSTRRRAAQIVAGAVALGAAALAGAGTVAAVIAAGVVVRRVQQLRRTGADRRATAAAVPDAVELLVALVRAGATPTQAVLAAAGSGPAPTRTGFLAVVQLLERGRRLADALDALPDRLGPGARPVADAIAAADRYGLPLGPVLERLADDARATRRRLAEAHARTLPARLTLPLVACTLPSFVLLAIVPAVLGTVASLRGTAP